jgi:hypothetical protein
MEIKETLITPEMATKWLEGNTHNRSIRDSKVDQYARDMLAGKWRLTHQGIAFDTDETLQDGQHRLWAIVNSGRPTRMMVARGVPKDAQAVIDDNIPRSVVDALKFSRGQEATPMHVAIAKWLLKDTLSVSATRQEVIAKLSEHREAIDFAASVMEKKVRGISITPVLTVIARAFYTQNRDKLARFGQILTTGRINDDAEDAALLLRNWLLEGAPLRKAAGVNRAVVIYQKTERALMAFLRQERLATLYIAASELFPLPISSSNTAVPMIKPKRSHTRKKTAAK